MKHKGLAARVRDFIRAHRGRDFTVDQIATHLDMTYAYKARQRVNGTLDDFTKRGELVRVSKGVYRYDGHTPPGGRPINEKMWSVLRSKRQSGSGVTTADLQELTGASARYAKEFMQTLARQGVVTRRGARWVMVKDPVIMPADSEKAARLRSLRARKKALAMIDTGINALLEARLAVSAIPEEEA